MLDMVDAPRGTDAQQRAALHAHILLWLKARVKRADCCDLDPVPRTAPGAEQRQRPRDQTVPPLAERHEDNVYQVREAARISAEMARPDVTGERWGGYTAATLRMVGLARAIQSRLPYLHSCTPNYCLKNRWEPCSIPIRPSNNSNNQRDGVPTFPVSPVLENT